VYYYRESYTRCGRCVARMFNPSHAAQHLGPDGVDAPSDIQPLAYHNLIVGMKSEVNAYTSPRAWASWSTRRAWRPSPTPRLVLFWRRNGHKFPTWAAAARIMFSMTPNSASAERVFSLLKVMFGDARASSLSDLVLFRAP
jgi:hypothetical protein